MTKKNHRSVISSALSETKKIIKCKSCGLVQARFFGSPDEIYEESFFDDEKVGYTDYEALRLPFVRRFTRELNAIEKIAKFSGNAKLLDIGAATGVMLEVAGLYGYEAVDIEVSDYAVEIGQSRGLDLRC